MYMTVWNPDPPIPHFLVKYAHFKLVFLFIALALELILPPQNYSAEILLLFMMLLLIVMMVIRHGDRTVFLWKAVE